MDTEYLEFCPRLRRMIETGKSIDGNGEPIDIRAVSSLNNLRAIRELILQGKLSKTLEVGLAFGGSALTFLSSLKEVSPDSFQHSAIDPFQSGVWGGSSRKVISDEGYDGHFTLHEEFSAQVLPALLKKGERYELIYVDGSHLFEDAFVDFYYSSQLLAEGGIVLFDDCTDPHVKKLMKFIRTNYSGLLREIDYTTVDDPNKSAKKKLGNKLGIRQLCGFKKLAQPPRDWDAQFVNF